jgi:uncharacterized protein (DUF2235 family)
MFMDGTWNRPEANTNVWRCKLLVADEAADEAAEAEGRTRQVVYYREGVGSKWYTRISGGAIGAGLGGNVVHAYGWLMEHYTEGDDVFLFGFSRGAFTARTLAGMIARCGLLHPGAPLSVGEVFRRYRDSKPGSAGAGQSLLELTWLPDEEKSRLPQFDRWLLAHSRRIDIHFIGVWDTVGTLGIPVGAVRGLSKSNQFHNTNPSVLYKNMYQALAIDEHRGPYGANLWTGFQPEGKELTMPKPDQKLEQRWFIGAHSNVGGGYRSDPLALVPLAWLLTKAGECGLEFKRALPLTGDEHMAALRDSFKEFLKGAYRLIRLGRRHYRPIGAAPRPTKSRPGLSHNLEETIDKSVILRWQADSAYRPKNLSNWAESADVVLDRLSFEGRDHVVARPR